MGIRKVSMTRLCVAILLSLAAYVLEGMAIHFMMETAQENYKTSGGQIPRRKRGKSGVRIAFLCEFCRMITLGSGAGIAEIHYMHENGIEPGHATALTMIQYMLKRAAVMVLGILGFAVLCSGSAADSFCREYAPFMEAAGLLSLVVIVGLLCLALSDRIAGFALRLLDSMTAKWSSWKQRFSGWKEQILLLNRSGKEILKQGKKIFCVTLCQLGKLLLLYSIPMYLLTEEIGLTVVEGIQLMAVVYMLSGVIPTPSGAGSLEVIFVLAFSMFTGVDMALSVILVFRFATWVMPFAVGSVLLLSERSMAKGT